MFESEALERIVQQQLQLIPDDHSIAVIAVTNGDGTRIVTAVRKGDWKIGGYIESTKLNGIGYGAEVMWSK